MDNKFSYTDIHLHFHPPGQTKPEIKEIILDEFPPLAAFYKNPNDNSALLGLMDGLNCERSWIINYEAPDTMGYELSTNEWVAEFCENSNNRLLPIGGIHPNKHENPSQILCDYIESGKLFGIKVHGPHQLIYPNDYINGNTNQRKMYQILEALQIPVIFHTGSSIFPKARSKYGNPIFLEDILIDFSDMIVIMSHGGRPFWTREAEYLMIKFPQLYFDISGVPPKLIPKYYPRFHRYADRVIFGSDYPSPGVPGSRVNAESITDLPLPNDTLQRILHDNATKILANHRYFRI